MSWVWEAGAPSDRRQDTWPSPASSRQWPSRGTSGWKGGPWKYPVPNVQEGEWKCQSCNEGNWHSRTHCCGCKTAKGSGAKGSGATRHRAENLSMLEALQTVVDNLGDNPLLDEIKQKLIADVKKLEKKTTDNRSLATQLVTLEGWIEREEKRICTAEDHLEEYKKLLGERKADFQVELAKLVSLKEAIVKEAEFKDPDPEEVPHSDMETDVPELSAKELDLRRQVSKKKDEKGVQIATKRLKEMEKEADGIRDKIESSKRPKTQASAPRRPEGAGAASSSKATDSAT